jgi:uncharacterized membrane protein
VTPPDLTSKEARRAYRVELHGVAAGWRFIGLIVVCLGVIGVLWNNSQGRPVFTTAVGAGSFALLVTGWIILAVAIFKRSAYHRRRMADG